MSKKTERSAVSPLLIGGAVVISLVIAVIIGMNLEKGSNDSPGTDSPDPATADGTEDAVDEEQRDWGESMALREADDPMALGEEDAPVVMIAYSDFTCPFCATWALETQPELVERYVDSGELRIEWREFPYLGEPADTLSIGALAAGEQDSFWEYQEVVFDSQDDLTSASQPEEELMGIVDDLGLDTDRFAEDLEDQELAEKVDADFSQGMQIGVSGTPAFIINGDPVMGAQPLDVFVNSIDLALAAAEG